jgi:ligand-binding SRPBCC domain-containing protein
MPGVNAELMPVVRMTYPRWYERLDRNPLVPGRQLFRSVLMLFGVLPVDVHAITLVSLTPGRGFLESSSSLLHRHWIHERALEPGSAGTKLSDRVYFECRVPGLDAALTPVVRAVFRHRHAQLRRRFGTR